VKRDWCGEDPSRFAYARTYDVEPRDPLTYEPVPATFPVRFCHSPKLREIERPEQDGMAVLDGSGYAAALATGPAFGCVHWEPEP
jgi:hypothetical protein